MALNLSKLMKRGAPAPPPAGGSPMDALMAPGGGAPSPTGMVPPEDMGQLMKSAVKPTAKRKPKPKPKKRGKRY